MGDWEADWRAKQHNYAWKCELNEFPGPEREHSNDWLPKWVDNQGEGGQTERGGDRKADDSARVEKVRDRVIGAVPEKTDAEVKQAREKIQWGSNRFKVEQGK